MGPRRQMTCRSVIRYSTRDDQNRGQQYVKSPTPEHHAAKTTSPETDAWSAVERTTANTAMRTRPAGDTEASLGLPDHSIVSPYSESRDMGGRRTRGRAP